MHGCIAGSQYMPSIEFFAHWVYHGTISIEAHEHFQKRTWRNKTAIVGPDEPLILSVPLKKGKHHQKPITEVEISYDEQWHRIHYHSISTAYGKTAYFEEIDNALRTILYAGYSKLWDLNMELLTFLKGFIRADLKLTLTETYEQYLAEDSVDLRKGIPAGVSSLRQIDLPKYHQVQRLQKDHMPNLSILDLLCHTGPATIDYLRLYSDKLYEKHAKRH